MTTLLFNYSDILLPHLVAKFPQYNIIHDFKKINIKLKTLFKWQWVKWQNNKDFYEKISQTMSKYCCNNQGPHFAKAIDRVQKILFIYW